MNRSILDDSQKIKSIDRSNMIQFCIDQPKLLAEATELAAKIQIEYPKPDNVIVSGMGGSGIGGDLLKDWARDKSSIPIEVNRDYNLPAYAGKKTLALLTSYSGDTEETLGSFLDALKRKCMIFCICSGGALMEYAEKLKIPHLKVQAGMQPRAALPYMFAPLLIYMEKAGLVQGAQEELKEAIELLEKTSKQNNPDEPSKNNQAKKLALEIGQTAPVTYGFGFYRSVAMRFKQQFNENSKLPSKWEVFSELNHNEIVGWERAGNLSKAYTAIFIRDREEPIEIKSRIEITKEVMEQENVKILELNTVGKGRLARMLSTVCVGDFTSVYLSYLNGVDPTPVKTISYLKETLNQNKVKEKILFELAKQS